MSRFQDVLVEKQFANIQLSDGVIIKPWYRKKDSIYYYFLPSYTDMESTLFVLDKGNIMIDGKQFINGDNITSLCFDKKYTIEQSFSSEKQDIIFKKLENTPIVFVDTATKSMKEVYHSKNHKQGPVFWGLARYTMPVFLMHTIFAASLIRILFKFGISSVFVHFCAGIIISFGGPILAMKTIEKLKPMDFLVYPTRYIKVGVRK